MPWRDWIDTYFAPYTTAPMAERHERVWEWAAALQPNERSRPIVECWPRGGAKSTTIELICAWLASSPSPRRHFALYVSNTQEQANSHVASISGMIEHVGVGRDLNRYGASRGWTRTLLRTNTGFNLMAFGLDTGMRGIKLDRYRPDLIIFDDFDDRHDTDHMIQKKIETITTSILPAESSDCAIIVIQNRIHKKSIMSKLLDGTADFLLDRLPAHEEPAVRDFAYSTAVVAGEPVYDVSGIATWAGQSLATCAHQMRRWGTHAFKREAQHDMRESEGGLWNRARDIDPYRTTTLPATGLDRICVAIDPSTTSGGDMCGIAVGGISYEYDGAMQPVAHGYVLDDVSIQGSPNAWATQAVAAYHKYRADLMVAERNNGGEMVTVTIGTVPGAPMVVTVWASRGKITRAEPIQKIYENGRVHHVGVFAEMEEEMCTYVHKAGQESPNRMDALVWMLTTLMIGEADMSDAVGDMMRENEDLYAYVE